MAYTQLKSDIAAVIYNNGNQEITGNILQGVLIGMVDGLTEGYQYMGVATPSTSTTGITDERVFYIAGQTGTYSNMGGSVHSSGIGIFLYNGSAWSYQNVPLSAITTTDAAPTAGSTNPVQSGGTFNAILTDGSAFDLSAYNSGTTYADLSAALTAMNSLPAAYKKGGMSVKFVQTSDNKYVQFRLMSKTFSTTESDWQSSITQKDVDSYGFADNNVGSISIAQRPSSIGNPFKNLGYVYDTNGKKVTAGNYACTDLLPIFDTIRVGIKTASLGIAAICFYDSTKTFLSYIGYSTIGSANVFYDYTPTIPSNAAYFTVNVYKAAITECYIVCGNVEQYLDNKIEFPELMHTIYDSSLTREHKIYTDAGVGGDNTDYDAVKFNVSEGDVLRITCNIGSGANYHAVKFYTSTGGSLVSTHLLNGDFIDVKLVVPDTATYAICQGRTTNGYGNTNHITLKVDLYSKYKENSTLVEYDALMLEPFQGYYRNTASPFLTCSSRTLGYRVSVPVPVIVGDIITAGTSVSYPFDTIVHVTFDSNKNILGTLDMVNGRITITQTMWNNGVRYIAICYRSTDTLSLTITRSTDMGVFTFDRALRMRISPYSAGFILWVPTKQNEGRYIGYRFQQEYKKWDSLEYEDGDGNTQTLTDVVNTDVWNCSEIYNDNMQYIAQGNTNFIFSIDSKPYVGDGHGNEAVMFNQFLIDGEIKEIASNDTYFDMTHKQSFELDSFECVWKSNIYQNGGGGQYTNVAKPYIKPDGTLLIIAEHYLNAKFEYGNKIRIENTLNIKKDNLTFMSFNGAMLECYFGNFSYLSVNDDNDDINQVADDGTVTPLANSTNLAPGTGSAEYQGLAVKANEAKIWGKDFSIMQRMEPKYNDRLTKCGIYIHKYADRIKCYFQPIITTQTASALGTKETLNAGDVISVVDYREIEM